MNIRLQIHDNPNIGQRPPSILPTPASPMLLYDITVYLEHGYFVISLFCFYFFLTSFRYKFIIFPIHLSCFCPCLETYPIQSHFNIFVVTKTCVCPSVSFLFFASVYYLSVLRLI